MSAPCSICGWGGSGRNGAGLCIDRAACSHRYLLAKHGRPRESACKCLVWPCPCACHVHHLPEIQLDPEPKA